MLKLFCPCRVIPAISEMVPEELFGRGIRGVILDLDNTVVPWGEEEVPPAHLAWTASAKECGLKLCLVSNSRARRTKKIARQLAIPWVSWALKPLSRGFLQAMKILDVSPLEIAVIGDQLLTDVLGGNRQGFYTVLVSPLSQREFITTKFNRILEAMAIKKLRTQGLWPEQMSEVKIRSSE